MEREKNTCYLRIRWIFYDLMANGDTVNLFIQQRE